MRGAYLLCCPGLPERFLRERRSRRLHGWTRLGEKERRRFDQPRQARSGVSAARTWAPCDVALVVHGTSPERTQRAGGRRRAWHNRNWVHRSQAEHDESTMPMQRVHAACDGCRRHC